VAAPTDLYHAVLDNACGQLIAATGVDESSEASWCRSPQTTPAGFRLLFHNAREPEFRHVMDRFHTDMTTVAIFIGFAEWGWVDSDPVLEAPRMALLRRVRDWEPRFRLMFPHPTRPSARGWMRHRPAGALAPPRA
jgi:hypothetical protein